MKELKEAFIEGYKQRARGSNLIFDETSELYAEVLFKEWYKKQLQLGVVMPELLCKNNLGAIGFLTIDKKYKLLNIEENYYPIIDDTGIVNYYSKNRFEIIETQ